MIRSSLAQRSTPEKNCSVQSTPHTASRPGDRRPSGTLLRRFACRRQPCPNRMTLVYWPLLQETRELLRTQPATDAPELTCKSCHPSRPADLFRWRTLSFAAILLPTSNTQSLRHTHLNFFLGLRTSHYGRRNKRFRHARICRIGTHITTYRPRAIWCCTIRKQKGMPQGCMHATFNQS